MKIGIAGVGGIGSNVAMNLIRRGIHDLKIVDYDRVDESNLNRQFYFADQVGNYKVNMLYDNLMRIDSRSNISKFVLMLDENNISTTFGDCDIVVEGFDKKECKKMFFETLSNENKLLVGASGIAGTDLSNVRCRKMGNCYIVGDFKSDVNFDKVYSPKIMVITGMMSNIIIEEINNYE